MAFYVYILSDKGNSKFILGATQNLVKTVHEMKFMSGTSESGHQIKKLVYFESHEEYEEAKRREREMMLWDDNYMKTIIALQNGKFNDLYEAIF